MKIGCDSRRRWGLGLLLLGPGWLAGCAMPEAAPCTVSAAPSAALLRAAEQRGFAEGFAAAQRKARALHDVQGFQAGGAVKILPPAAPAKVPAPAAPAVPAVSAQVNPLPLLPPVADDALTGHGFNSAGPAKPLGSGFSF
jgi:hypothetical protein